jgi:hypothetical protein
VNGATLATGYVVDAFNADPNPPTLFPKTNFDATTASQFSWTFSDPNGDTQSAYQLEISNASTGVVVLDTGKVLSTSWFRNVAGSTLTNGADYRWRVKTWDALDASSAYSGYGVFTASAGGSVSITNPAADNPEYVITDDIPVTWSVTGTTQSAYRITLYRGATLVSDTGWIASAATSATVTGMLSDELHEIRVQVRNAALVVTNTAVRLVTPSYSTPEKPLITVQPEPEAGYVLIVIENPTPGQPALGFPEDDFDAGIGTWSAGPNAAVTHDTVITHRGAGALRITSTLNGQDPVYGRDYSNFRPVTPGNRYTVRMWVYPSITANIAATIDFFAANYDYITSLSFSQTLPGGQWSQLQATATAPISPVPAAFAVYGPSLAGGVASGAFVVADEMVLTYASDRPDVASNSVLRRAAGTVDAFEVLGTVEPDGTFRDYTATAAINYEYVVRGNA